MRYTLFVKHPGRPFDFHEGDDLDLFMGWAKEISKSDPQSHITVCDRRDDIMLYRRENGTGGECRIALSGMFV